MPDALPVIHIPRVRRFVSPTALSIVISPITTAAASAYPIAPNGRDVRGCRANSARVSSTRPAAYMASTRRYSICVSAGRNGLSSVRWSAATA